MNEKQIASSAVVFIIAVGAFIFTSCSDFSTDLKGDSVLDYGTGAGSLLTCNDKLEGKVVKPADGSEYRLCKGGQWFAVEIGDFDEADVIKPTAKSSSSTKEDIAKSSSSQKSEASKQSSSSKKVIVFDDEDEDILPSKQSSSSDKTAPSSSSATNVPASSTTVNPPEKIEISSSSKDNPTSSWSSEAAIGSSSSIAVKPSSSSVAVIVSSSSKNNPMSSWSSEAAIGSSSSVSKPASSSSEKIVEPEPESSSEEIVIESSSSKDPVEDLYICEDGETIVVDMMNCPENQEPESSSSEEANSSSSEDEVDEPEPESSSEAVVDPNAKYDCTVYNCVTTEYLNQEMLAAGKYGELLDERDNQVYRTIKIGEQTWMAQNLNYETDDKLSSICFLNDPENCKKFGRLYTWSTVMAIDSSYNNKQAYGNIVLGEEHQGICPHGWHVSTSNEWLTLDYYVQSEATYSTGTALKSKELWEDPTEIGKDVLGMSILPSGGVWELSTKTEFYGELIDAPFWTNTTDDSDEVLYVPFFLSERSSLLTNKNYKVSGFGLRCVKNSEPAEETPMQSSSSEETESSSTAEVPSAKYDCTKYNCVTTEYLNQEMLAAGKYGEFLDERDNQVYRTIKIGEQTWMAQNLNFETEDSRCYSGSTENCAEFGRLYYQSEAKDVCPSGWHLPSNEEWNILNDFVDDNNGTQGVGNSLKSLTWTYGESGSDLFGFSGLASHFFGSVLFCGSSTHGLYWTADNNEYRCLLSDNSILYYYKDSNSDTWGMSVRCLKDDNTQNPSIESSSSEETVEPESSSAVIAPLAKYDCSEYNCVTTEYLNQELLAAGKYGEILDERDNQVYRTIKIGEQTWMAQNLNYDTTTAYTYCASNTAVNCQKYGRIYKSSIALKVCPTGWHLPKTGDWQNLYDFVYSNKKLESNTVGSYLKSTKLWTTPGTDDYGFAAVPGGYLWYNGTYKNVDIGGYFWTTTTGTSLNNIPWYFPGGETLTTDDVRSTSDGFYVRCVMN